MAGPEPGAEFLQRRLARATAVPPAERSPQVAAFVESMQLLREARELLPLMPAGTPALPDSRATRHKMLRAQLRSARADYLCLKFPPPKKKPSATSTPALVERWAEATPYSRSWGICCCQYLMAMGGTNVKSVRLRRDVSVIVGNPECQRRLQSRECQVAHWAAHKLEYSPA